MTSFELYKGAPWLPLHSLPKDDRVFPGSTTFVLAVQRSSFAFKGLKTQKRYSSFSSPLQRPLEPPNPMGF
jgi:hypothetical protein